MKLDSKTRKLQANKNMFIAKKDLSEVYGNCIYLGIYDKQENYTEVNQVKKDEILASIEEKQKFEEEKMNKEVAA